MASLLGWDPQSTPARGCVAAHGLHAASTTEHGDDRDCPHELPDVPQILKRNGCPFRATSAYSAALLSDLK
jgi:hypothetical protein